MLSKKKSGQSKKSHQKSSKKILQLMQERRVRLYLGGLPPKTTPQQIRSCFSQLGELTKIEIPQKFKKRVCKGFANVTVELKKSWLKLYPQRKDLVEAIIAMPFEIDNRQIFVSKYLKGNKLKKKRKEISEKRVFISGIPTQVTDTDLALHFSKFGRVQSAYQIKSVKGKKLYFGFVSFVNLKSVDLCLQANFIEIKGAKITIKKFKNEFNNPLAENIEQAHLNTDKKFPVDSREMSLGLLENSVELSKNKNIFENLDQEFFQRLKESESDLQNPNQQVTYRNLAQNLVEDQALGNQLSAQQNLIQNNFDLEFETKREENKQNPLFFGEQNFRKNQLPGFHSIMSEVRPRGSLTNPPNISNTILNHHFRVSQKIGSKKDHEKKNGLRVNEKIQSIQWKLKPGKKNYNYDRILRNHYISNLRLNVLR
jgi:RNA recognition motif-containing protein